MPEEALRLYAQTFKGTSVHVPGPTNLPDLVVNHGVTRIHCWFSEGKLQTVEIVWISAPMKVTTEPKKNLCEKPSALSDPE